MTLAGKTVLVTGATGFLGGALALRLVADGVHVRALARRPRKAEFLREVKGIDIVPGDIGDLYTMQTVVRGCDYVFHAAAALGGDYARQHKVNVEGTRNVMLAAAEAKVTRVVHVSTMAVYGYNQDGDVTEDTPPAPKHDPYNLTKAEAETAVRDIGAQHHLSYSIIRPAMIYGPRSNMWTRTMFSIARRNPTIFVGSGQGTAYPIFIDDVVDLLIIAATYPAADNQTFNCAPDPSPTWREYLGAYSQIVGHQNWLGIPVALIYPFAVIAAAFAGTKSRTKDVPDILRFLQRRVTFKMTKARDLLNWQPKVDLQTGVERCIPWLREKGLIA